MFTTTLPRLQSEASPAATTGQNRSFTAHSLSRRHRRQRRPAKIGVSVKEFSFYNPSSPLEARRRLKLIAASHLKTRYASRLSRKLPSAL